MNSRNFIVSLVLAALAAAVLWQFVLSSPFIRGATSSEGETIMKEATIGLMQHAYPKGDARELAGRFPLSLSGEAIVVARAGKPCELTNSCEREFPEAREGLSWNVVGATDSPPSLLGSLKNWWLQRSLNRAIEALSFRHSPQLPAIDSSDSFLIDLCAPAEDISLKNSCSAPAIVGSLAFVKIVSDCGDLCGATSLVALERRDGAWVAIAVGLLAQE